MYSRIKRVRVGSTEHQYLQIVKSRREGGKVRQSVVASLGRLDAMQADGGVDRLLESMGRFAAQVQVISALREGEIALQEHPEWGPALVFGRLWEELGLAGRVSNLARGRRFAFDVERMAFAVVLQRLIKPKTGSDREGSRWVENVYLEGVNDTGKDSKVGVKRFYRTVAFLSEHQDEIEQALWDRRRDLFNPEVDVALFDTTTLWFEGEGPEDLARRGKSKGGKYQYMQVVVGVVLTGDGWPICLRVWLGNTSDAKTVVPILDTLRERFEIRHVVFVADRGMTSQANLEAIRDAGYDYIVGCKLRGDEQVQAGEDRYVVCHNPGEEERDREERERILAELRAELDRGGPKQFVVNSGYRRFLDSPAHGAFAIDEARVEEDARYDGKYVLRTSTSWDAERVALAWKSLWQVERYFRDFKGMIGSQTIYHRLEDMVRGHLVGCFLALYLAVDLRKRLAALGDEAAQVDWDGLIQDLREVRASRLVLGERRYLVRGEFQGNAHLAFKAAGLQPPPRVQEIDRPGRV